MITQQIFGQSALYGASYLPLASNIEVVESVALGGSVYTNTLGKFNIESFTLPTQNNERITLSANHLFDKIFTDRAYGSRLIKSGKVITAKFRDGDSIDGNLFFGNYSGLSRQFGYWITGEAIENAYLGNQFEFQDVYMSSKFKVGYPIFVGASVDSVVYGSTFGNFFGHLIRSSDASDPTGQKGYVVGLIGATQNLFIIGKLTGTTSITILNSVGFTPLPTAGEYDLVTYAERDKIYGAIAGRSFANNYFNTDYGDVQGVTFSTRLFASDTSYRGGDMGFYANSVVGRTVLNNTLAEVGTVRVSTLDAPITYEDAIRSSLYLADTQLKFTAKSDQIDARNYISNGSWTVGVSEFGFANLAVTSGGSLLSVLFATTGVGFRLEAEMKGASGVQGGLVVGSSSSFYGMVNTIGSTNPNNIVYKSGNTWKTYQNGNPFLQLAPNVWHKCTVDKSATSVAFYVNGRLSNYITTTTDSNFVPLSWGGVLSLQNGVSGGTLMFKNIRAHLIPTVTDSLSISSAESTSSIMQRFKPDNYDYILGNSVVVFERLGISKSLLGITNVYVNNSGRQAVRGMATMAISRGEVFLDMSRKSNLLIDRLSLENRGVVVDMDTNIKQESDLDMIGDNRIADELTRSKEVNFTTVGLPLTEKLDHISFRDSTTGVTINGQVISFNRSADFTTGSYTEDINLITNLDNID